MAMPASCSISLSSSTNGTSSRAASRAPSAAQTDQRNSTTRADAGKSRRRDQLLAQPRQRRGRLLFEILHKHRQIGVLRRAIGQKVLHRHVERDGQLVQQRDRYIALATLDSRQIRHRHARLRGELLARHAALRPQDAHAPRQIGEQGVLRGVRGS
jgi:hypothetical protein